MDSRKLSRTSIRELWGVVLTTVGVLSLLALISYDPGDISQIKVPPNSPPVNFIGPTGAWFAFIALMTLGLAAAFIPVWFFMIGALLLFFPDRRVWLRALWGVLALLVLSSILQLHSSWFENLCEKVNIRLLPGGMAGMMLAEKGLAALLGHTGANVIIIGLLAACLLMLAGMDAITATLRRIGLAVLYIKSRISAKLDARRGRIEKIAREERELHKQRVKMEKTLAKESRRIEKPVKQERLPVDEPVENDVSEEAAPVDTTQTVNIPIVSDKTEDGRDEETVPYQLPPLSLLNDPPAGSDREIKSDFETTSRILKETLAEFGVECEITNVVQGPVVTRFEILPAPGVRVERIAGLSNNLALSLKATSVRVQAPIPGKGVVGVEVPNTLSSKVYIKDIIQSDEWQTGMAALPLILGKDVSGKAIVADLARMPHLLIAGATGSGKTVCMNSILTGLLMTRTPDQMRMMLVDPKIVEFSGYNNLPHLIVPVITDPKKVILGLRWAINEMESRYKIFAKAGVRNIEAFNGRGRKADQQLDCESEEEENIPATLPYIVIIIDELADLMMVAKVDVEYAITRLAQLSRAVGIHMIIATQRPSVNVITGTIKANFPARISFQVAQMTDSRTILDAKGAEKLLGRGDMLFMPPGISKLVRAQGAMTTDEETRAVVKFIKNQQKAVYEVAIKESIESGGSSSTSLPESGDDEDEELLEMAVTIIRESKRASTSSLQRRLRIGYNRAARLMDQLEEKGIIGPPRGSEPREILVDLDADMALNGDDTRSETEQEDA